MMQNVEIVSCPWCGQSMELALDVSEGTQVMTTDCEVCCRPFELEVRVRDGEVTGVHVGGG